MKGKDKPCVCGHNRWKTIKKKKIWQCRNSNCGKVRDLEDVILKAQRADSISMSMNRVQRALA